MTNPTLTPQEAADLLGVSYYTVIKYIKTGLLPATCDLNAPPTSRRYKISRTDVMALASLRKAGGDTFKPGPNGENKGKTLMYLPRPAEWGAWVKRLLSSEERAVILEGAAREREVTPN